MEGDQRRLPEGLLAPCGCSPPNCVAKSNEVPRPGYDGAEDASEYLDEGSTLTLKVRRLAEMIRASRKCIYYTGAGISTASGTPDYASKARHSKAPHRGKSEGNRLEAQPTYGHHALAALARKANGKVLWLEQNHDRLALKAGFPVANLNEIHGAWGDNKNRVKMMDDTLRRDLREEMEDWAQNADLCIALGTSLCGMTAD